MAQKVILKNIIMQIVGFSSGLLHGDVVVSIAYTLLSGDGNPAILLSRI